jgi:alkylation response protein AidB-like acyl-CoA dehydrogenase
MSVTYANERVQFGKPIAKQQAVQQQLAVLAEQTLMARFASAAGCRGNLNPSLLAAASAKQVASAAVPRIVSIAHAVHGAIGITAEFDLQLYTRRLLEWRLADGSEDYWARLLGEARLDAPDVSTVDFIRRAVFAVGNEMT